jgi:hypothetical protein
MTIHLVIKDGNDVNGATPSRGLDPIRRTLLICDSLKCWPGYNVQMSNDSSIKRYWHYYVLFTLSCSGCAKLG